MSNFTLFFNADLIHTSLSPFAIQELATLCIDLKGDGRYTIF